MFLVFDRVGLGMQGFASWRDLSGGGRRRKSDHEPFP